MHLLRLSIINFATILSLTKIADRVGSSHFEFDPDEFKAKFEANKGKVYSETQKCFMTYNKMVILMMHAI